MFFLAAAITSCEKQDGVLDDIRPEIPVTVPNATDYRPDPTVTTSLSGTGTITITIAVPEGRTIKEITKVATSTTYTQIQSTGTTGFYTTAPIPVNASTYTFTTSLTEYFQKNPVVPVTNPAATANVELARRFYFMITMEDGSVIFPRPVRILVLA